MHIWNMYIDTSEFWLLKALLQLNFSSLVIKLKQKQTNKETPNKVHMRRMSFKTQLQEWVICAV